MSEGLISQHCIRCKHLQGAHFCPNCGQPAQVPRLRLRNILLEFFDRLFGVNGMFVRTMVHLFTKPGLVAATYIKGDRRSYLGPVAYFLIITTVYLLYIQLVEFDFQGFFDQAIDDYIGEVDEQTLRTMEMSAQVSMKFMRIVNFANAFFLAIALWLVYRKSKGLNYIEQLAASLYVTAQTVLFTLFTMVIYTLFGYSSTWSPLIFNALLVGWLTATQYTSKPSLHEFIKGFTALIISYAILLVASLFVGLIIGLLAAAGWIELPGVFSGTVAKP